MVQPHNRILLGNKKEGTISTRNHIDESQSNYAEWKNPGVEEYKLYASI